MHDGEEQPCQWIVQPMMWGLIPPFYKVCPYKFTCIVYLADQIRFYDMQVHYIHSSVIQVVGEWSVHRMVSYANDVWASWAKYFGQFYMAEDLPAHWDRPSASTTCHCPCSVWPSNIGTTIDKFLTLPQTSRGNKLAV